RLLVRGEVVVVEHVGCRVPQVFVNRIAPGGGPAVPLRNLCTAAEQGGEMSHVPLVFVEKAVEADGRVVLRRTAEGTEAKTRVEAGFAHRPVSAIKVAAEAMSVNVRVGADLRCRDVAARL